jgi:hypothetical protein
MVGEELIMTSGVEKNRADTFLKIYALLTIS